jgi:type IX secretion system PorP/SprF family membrane protein
LLNDRQSKTLKHKKNQNTSPKTIKTLKILFAFVKRCGFDYLCTLIFNYMKKIFLISSIFLAFFTKNQAQDTHFTQFYATTATLNPALTGVIDGKYRVSSIYRDQWRKVLDNPIKTFSLAADLRFKVPGNHVKEDAMGIGLMVFQDKVSITDFATTQIALSYAFHKALDIANSQFLSLGIQGGLTQRNLNYESLNFHDEFDGITGYTGQTFEELPENNFSYSDLNVGLNYSAKLSKGASLITGVAMHHVLKPSVSFYKNGLEGEKLNSKYSAQIAANLPINNRVSFMPRFLIANQGQHLEINTGANFRTALGEFGGNALHLGSWIRPVRNANGIGIDAVVLLAGFEMNSVQFGLSYDLNISALAKAGARQGAFEISAAYMGNYDNEEIVCPKF